jgi:hypothetical protein
MEVETGLRNRKIMQPLPCLHTRISVCPSVRHSPSTSGVSEMKTIVSNIRSLTFCVVHNVTCPSWFIDKGRSMKLINNLSILSVSYYFSNFIIRDETFSKD